MSPIAHTPSSHTVARSLSLLAFAFLTAHAQAQSNISDARQQPAAIGVSPSTAADANDRTVPRADTGTVVRTGPTPGERVNNATSSAADATRNSMGKASGANSNAVSVTPDSSRDMSSQSGNTENSRNTRRPRSDRG